MDARFTLLDEKMDAGFKRLDKKIDGTHSRLTRLESKLDRFVAAETRFNRLAEARLRRLEAADRA